MLGKFKCKTHQYCPSTTKPDLLYYIDAVVDLLSLQEGVEVVEEGTEVGLPVPIWHHYCCVVAGFTVWRAVASAWQHQRVPLSDLLQRQGSRKMDRHGSDWRKGKCGKKVLIVWFSLNEAGIFTI